MRVRFIALTVALMAACGTSPDPRDPTLEVVTFEVLAPTCGQVQCHSTFTMTEGLAFDTLEDSIESLNSPKIEAKVCATAGCGLLDVLDGAAGKERMPPDVPLAKEDRALLDTWLNAGAPGL